MPTCPNTRSLVLLGGGGHALVIAEAATLAGFTILSFYDDADQPALAAVHHDIFSFGRLRDIQTEALTGEAWIIALGDLATRRRLIDRLSDAGAQTVIHPRAMVSPSATIEPGAFVGPGAIINPEARIRSHAIINSGAIIEHGCDIGDNAHIAPGAVLGGDVRVGPDTLVGLGSRVLPGVTIGSACTIGAGAVVIRDVQNDTTAVGCPARTFRSHAGT